MRGRTIPLVFGSLTAFATAAYLAILYISYQRENAENSKAVVPLDVSERYNEIAPSFDDSIDSTERLMGLIKLRKKLAQEAYGDVCEVSIGTGRNLTYYDWNFKGVNGVGTVQRNNRLKTGKVNSFTAVDKSPEMLEIAHEKFSKECPGILGVRWVVQDASKPLPPPPVSVNERSGKKIGKKYDTIIQTMGLCSTPDPVALLKNLGNSVEPDGRILLLEHGQSTWNFVNNHLDRRAPRHAEEFGCWWNKDIGKIIEESGLEVVKIKRKHFGTTWWIELKPKKTDTASEGKSD
jgi:methyltransferase OMS1